MTNKIEDRTLPNSQIHIEALPYEFSVCKVIDYSLVNPEDLFSFPQKTDEENSLVCLRENVPANTIEREDGWRAFRIKGSMDFALIGVLAGISKVLAEESIGIFVISTYNTDYVLVKEGELEQALTVLRNNEYVIER